MSWCSKGLRSSLNYVLKMLNYLTKYYSALLLITGNDGQVEHCLYSFTTGNNDAVETHLLCSILRCDRKYTTLFTELPFSHFTDLSKYFNAKVSLEHQLPTATQKLKVTDECIVSALVSLVTCTSKVRLSGVQ